MQREKKGGMQNDQALTWLIWLTGVSSMTATSTFIHPGSDSCVLTFTLLRTDLVKANHMPDLVKSNN